MGQAEEKTVGRGRGRYTAAGVQADQEARITALEDYISDQIDAGTLPEPIVDEEETAPPA